MENLNYLMVSSFLCKHSWDYFEEPFVDVSFPTYVYKQCSKCRKQEISDDVIQVRSQPYYPGIKDRIKKIPYSSILIHCATEENGVKIKFIPLEG